MLRKDYDRHYVCEQIDQEAERIETRHSGLWSRQDQLLVDAAEVQILLGNDKAAYELLKECFAGGNLISAWEIAEDETEYDC